MEIIRTNCLSPVSTNGVLFLPDHFIMIEEGKILNITPTLPVELEQYELVCPGLLQV